MRQVLVQYQFLQRVSAKFQGEHGQRGRRM